jgi:hypothetical protein
VDVEHIYVLSALCVPRAQLKDTSVERKRKIACRNGSAEAMEMQICVKSGGASDGYGG